MFMLKKPEDFSFEDQEKTSNMAHNAVDMFDAARDANKKIWRMPEHDIDNARAWGLFSIPEGKTSYSVDKIIWFAEYNFVIRLFWFLHALCFKETRNTLPSLWEYQRSVLNEFYMRPVGYVLFNRRTGSGIAEDKLVCTPHSCVHKMLRGKGLLTKIYSRKLKEGWSFYSEGHTWCAANLWLRVCCDTTCELGYMSYEHNKVASIKGWNHSMVKYMLGDGQKFEEVFLPKEDTN
jgi:hypothetical protein